MNGQKAEEEKQRDEEEEKAHGVDLKDRRIEEQSVVIVVTM